jgi:hypothetical protein
MTTGMKDETSFTLVFMGFDTHGPRVGRIRENSANDD